ncbi:DUF4232 domain-containing protein [Isoptericola croceus]|uniref:DUF4232 domain-containing protein n=1 Tax=Isoptericola croceus TaxID=3031406 RepID=UPI0023F80125|nr:DUF4232 domain-containing protein [Isoptericola croceus]
MSRRFVLCWVVALVVVGVTIGVWRPWDPVPGELRDALGPVEAVPGVVGTDLGYEVLQRDPKDGDAALADLEVRLDEHLAPEEAGAAAAEAAALFRAAHVPGVDLTRSVRFAAGDPVEVGAVTVFPLATHSSDDPAGAVSQAFELWQAGAARVSTGFAETTGTDELLALADVAAQRGIVTSLATLDATVRYDTDGDTVDPAQVRLAVEAAQRDGVETAISSGLHGLSVHTTSAGDSDAAAAVVAWIEERRPPGDDPVPYTVSSPGYATFVEGWVGGVAPPEPEPHPVRMPAGTEPWPADDSAAECTGADLELSLGTPDAATGGRYLAVHARNVSGEPCAVDGVPDVVFRNADGEAQQDVTIAPPFPGAVAERVVVPAGEQVLATLEWRAMSTANDPDVTTEVEVVAVPGAAPVAFVPRVPDLGGLSADEAEGAMASGGGDPTTLDVLDGAEVRVGPWAQAVDGWS